MSLPQIEKKKKKEIRKIKEEEKTSLALLNTSLTLKV